jgi:hypothetical protein
MSLRKKLADFGFESNDDFDFALRCLTGAAFAGAANEASATSKTVRTAELCGALVRRKTAFAHALGLALEFPHRVYYDFSERPKVQAVATPLSEDSEHDATDARAATPLSPFERALTEACAFSESARTLLVLDQLQLCDFRDQLRLTDFLRSGEWRVGTETSLQAHRRNLVVLLISDAALYHSLQKLCFRIFTDPSAGQIDFKPEDFGLASDTKPLIDSLSTLFVTLECQPTRGEFEAILRDCEARVRTPEQLRICLFGRIENLERAKLYASETTPLLIDVLTLLTTLLGFEELSC